MDRQEAIDEILQSLPARNMGQFLDILTDTYGSMPALRGVRVVDKELTVTKTLSFAELQKKIESCAARLNAMGLEPGDRVGLISENSVNADILKYACLRQGITVVPWTCQVDDAGMQAADVMESSNVRFIAYEKNSASLKQHWQRVVKGASYPIVTRILSSVNTIEIADDIGDMTFPHYRKMQDGETCRPADVEMHHPAFIVFSSGTGGSSPKQIEISHANLLYQYCVSPSVLDQPPGSNCLHVLPFYHIFGEVLEGQLRSNGQCVTLSDGRALKMHGKNLMQTGPYEFFAGVPEIFSGMRRKIENEIRNVIQRGADSADYNVLRKLQASGAQEVQNLLQLLMRDFALSNLRISDEIGGDIHTANRKYWTAVVPEAADPEQLNDELQKNTMNRQSLNFINRLAA